jgi:predicted transcriptional regulator
MPAITVRLDPELKERLRIEALIRNISQNEIITDAIIRCLEADDKAYRSIRESVVLARAKGRRPLDKSLMLAKKVAQLDDAEGLGEIKVGRPGTKRGK